MKKINENKMDLNRETAMRLWNKSFGKETKVVDFTGRTIVKGAYNDRKSEYGWNVDHILPQSRGGVTADYNLICCHILTNDEKADKFPCFAANSHKYEIIKVQNHYEIKPLSNATKISADNDKKVNFFDSASGVRFFKSLKGIQNKPRFVGTVLIRFQNISNTAVIDFIEKFLDEENISYSMSRIYWNDETKIVAKNYNMPMKEDISQLLDKCILLNTYLGHYFKPEEYISSYDIYYRVDYYKEKEEMYIESQNIDFRNVYGNGNNTLYINNLVIANTEASSKIEQDSYHEFSEYNYVFGELSKNLDKEVGEK